MNDGSVCADIRRRERRRACLKLLSVQAIFFIALVVTVALDSDMLYADDEPLAIVSLAGLVILVLPAVIVLIGSLCDVSGEWSAAAEAVMAEVTPETAKLPVLVEICNASALSELNTELAKDMLSTSEGTFGCCLCTDSFAIGKPAVGETVLESGEVVKIQDTPDNCSLSDDELWHVPDDMPGGRCDWGDVLRRAGPARTSASEMMAGPESKSGAGLALFSAKAQHLSKLLANVAGASCGRDAKDLEMARLFVAELLDDSVMHALKLFPAMPSCSSTKPFSMLLQSEEISLIFEEDGRHPQQQQQELALAQVRIELARHRLDSLQRQLQHQTGIEDANLHDSDEDGGDEDVASQSRRRDQLCQSIQNAQTELLDAAFEAAAKQKAASICTLGESTAMSLVERTLYNDEGAIVRPGTANHSRFTFYCGRLIQPMCSERRCGPSAGLQCASCSRFQEHRAQPRDVAELPPMELSPNVHCVVSFEKRTPSESESEPVEVEEVAKQDCSSMWRSMTLCR